MPGDYSDAIDYLYNLQKHGIKLGLDNIGRLLRLLGNPHDSFRSVHVAGTNGKGSTSAMIASVLRASGLSVGLFTSPHLVSFTERIRVDEKEITEAEVVALTNEIREIIESFRPQAGEAERDIFDELSPTFFEFVTAMGFLYFKRKGIQWAVVETGMGGRLDATNVLSPKVSVITRIGLDHREFLGDTLREIAGEKAGIIKRGVPVVSASQEPEALSVIAERTAAEGTRLSVFGRDFSAGFLESDMNGVLISYNGEARFERLRVPLCGRHQVENAAVALRAVELLRQEIPLDDRAVAEGLGSTRWPGRLELIRQEGKAFDILIDGAHNPAAAAALAGSLRDLYQPAYGRIILVLGIMADKDINGILEPLLPLASEVIFTKPEYARAAEPALLAERARSLGYCATEAASITEALKEASGRAASHEKRSLVVVTGSFYTIGEAKTILSGPGILTRLRE